MSHATGLTSQSEDYLEAIYELSADKGAARARDIARRLSVHKSTVTGALQSLSEKGLVDYTPYEATRLTARGHKVARDIARRHAMISRFLSDVLQLDAERAQANACRIEHAIGPKLVERLVTFVDFVEESPRFRAAWLKRIGVPCDCHAAGDLCLHCRRRHEEADSDR